MQQLALQFSHISHRIVACIGSNNTEISDDLIIHFS